MKIEQDPLTGKVLFKIDGGENVSTEHCLSALTEFVRVQAIETFRHTKECRRLVGRVD